MAFPYFMVMMMMTVRWYLDGKMVFLLPNLMITIIITLKSFKKPLIELNVLDIYQRQTHAPILIYWNKESLPLITLVI